MLNDIKAFALCIRTAKEILSGEFSGAWPHDESWKEKIAGSETKGRDFCGKMKALTMKNYWQ